jgi:hypothetical protein
MDYIKQSVQQLMAKVDRQIDNIVNAIAEGTVFVRP